MPARAEQGLRKNPGFRTSSYSAYNGNCIEVGLSWTKSSRSLGDGNCTEVARPTPDAVLVRDSKDPEGPQLCFSADVWRAAIAPGGAFRREPRPRTQGNR